MPDNEKCQALLPTILAAILLKTMGMVSPSLTQIGEEIGLLGAAEDKKSGRPVGEPAARGVVWR